MKKVVILICLIAVVVIAGTGALLTRKSSEAMNPAADLMWTTDYKKAFEQAKAENKLLMIDFGGETWCKPCIALHKQVFATQKFTDYAKDKFILVKVDFPDPLSLPTTGRELVDKYLPPFEQILLPTVVIVAPDGKALGDVGYKPGGPDVFIAAAQKVIGK